MGAKAHFSPNNDGKVVCGYVPPHGWAADVHSNVWTGDRQQVSCGACAAAMQAAASRPKT
jgi:hypothetical protein